MIGKRYNSCEGPRIINKCSGGGGGREGCGGGSMSFLDVEAGGLPSARRQQDPSQALAAAVFQINTAVSSFKRLSNGLGTPKDTPALREKLYACLHCFPFFLHRL